MVESRILGKDSSFVHEIVMRIGPAYLWMLAISAMFTYLVWSYLLPILGIISFTIMPHRNLVETALFMVMLTTGGVLVYSQSKQFNPIVDIANEFIIATIGSKYYGVVCLEVVEVVGSPILSEETPRYDLSHLLAIRAGLEKSVNYAYQFGTKNGEPFIRYFISGMGSDSELLKESLRREATRLEAILLSTINGISINLVKDERLFEFVNEMVGFELGEEGSLILPSTNRKAILRIEGVPKVAPTNTSSQVGTLISSALRQGFSLSITCVFSRATGEHEKRKLEQKWKRIRRKEKENEDSLSDHAMKSSLLNEYSVIGTTPAWYYSSVYVTYQPETPMEGIRGLVDSIWGGLEGFAMYRESLSDRKIYRILLKRHLKKQRIHANHLVAYVNAPVRQLPVIGTSSLPEFIIPSNERISNELEIGWVVYANRRLGAVGLKPEWLREHMAVMGATGTGKTNLVRKLMAEITTKTQVPWWIFDVKGSEYSDLTYMDANIVILRPGLDPTFVIDLFDSDSIKSDKGLSIFALLRELLQEESNKELSPAMERLLREAIIALAEERSSGFDVSALKIMIEKTAGNSRSGQMTCDALLNRLDILMREPLYSVLAGGDNSIRVSELLQSRVIFDLRFISQRGGMDAARFLYNLVAKRIFEAAMRRGIVDGLHHLVVLEEASNLVPESYIRHSAADVTTGESMVMLQRATGQGVIVISTRPNISTNILANTSTKISFRLPFDSSIGARFMSIEERQEHYLRTMPRGRALALLPGCNTFEIETEPFIIESKLSGLEFLDTEDESTSEKKINVSKLPLASSSVERLGKERVILFDKMGEIAKHIVGFLASREVSTFDDILEFLKKMNPRISNEDVKEILQELVSLSTIQREAISLVAGGFVYAQAGKGYDAIRKVIRNYLGRHLGEQEYSFIQTGSDLDYIIDDKAIAIFPERISSRSINNVIERIKKHMKTLNNGVNELIVIVRGSVAAAKLREFIDDSDVFEHVTIIPAFPSSLTKLAKTLTDGYYTNRDMELHTSEIKRKAETVTSSEEPISSSKERTQVRLWFGLIHEFLRISGGYASWEMIEKFIHTTATQSRKGRSVPLSSRIGKKALTELLADEALVAMRVGATDDIVGLESGVWVLSINVLNELKEKIIGKIAVTLTNAGEQFYRNHGYYNICGQKKSFVVFPTQQELTTLMQVNSDVACRICNSKEVVCILPAIEYIDSSVTRPSNLTIRTIDEGNLILAM